MAKILVRSSPGAEPVPFLRGILTRSLQDAGLSFDEAYPLSSDIRSRLSRGKDDREVTEKEIRELVEQVLQDGYSREVLNNYRDNITARDIVFVERVNSHVSPFSRALHQKRLEPCGLDTETAAEITDEVYEQLVLLGQHTYSSQKIREITQTRLRKHGGVDAERRYRLWNEFIRSGRPLLILIGGAPGCGKSTLSTSLASRLDIVRTQSTDMLREVMRMMMPERLLPALHTSSFSAWKKLPVERGQGASSKALVNGYLTQAGLLSVALEGAILRALKERVSMILEGVHIYPDLLRRVPEDTDAIVVPVMLGVLKADELRSRFKGRGKEVTDRRSKRYLDEFDSIWSLQSYLLSEADRTGIPIVRNNDKEEATHEVMRVIIDQIVEGEQRGE